MDDSQMDSMEYNMQQTKLLIDTLRYRKARLEQNDSLGRRVSDYIDTVIDELQYLRREYGTEAPIEELEF